MRVLIVFFLFIFAFGFYKDKIRDRKIAQDVASNFKNVMESRYDKDGYAKVSTVNLNENTGSKVEDFLNSSLNKFTKINNDNLRRIEELNINRIFDPAWMQDKTNHTQIESMLDRLEEIYKLHFLEITEYRNNYNDDYKKLTSNADHIKSVEEIRLKAMASDERMYELSLGLYEAYSKFASFLINNHNEWESDGNNFSFYRDEDINRFNHLIEEIHTLEYEFDSFMKSSY